MCITFCMQVPEVTDKELATSSSHKPAKHSAVPKPQGFNAFLSHPHTKHQGAKQKHSLNHVHLPIHSIHLPMSPFTYWGQGDAEKITYILIGALEVHFQIYGSCFTALEKIFRPSSTNGFDGKPPGRFSLYC